MIEAQTQTALALSQNTPRKLDIKKLKFEEEENITLRKRVETTAATDGVFENITLADYEKLFEWRKILYWFNGRTYL